MIKHLSIKNLLLIDEVDIELNNGLCVLTGETGAGKSMILDSLSLISGERIKASFKPEKGKTSSVSAIIDISNFKFLKHELQELGIDCDDEILIKRIITDSGKSKSFINDNLISLNILKKISSNLVEIHSQFSEQGLLDSNTHIDTLDEFGDYLDSKIMIGQFWQSLLESKKKFESKKEELSIVKNEREQIEYDLKEIENLSPLENEFNELVKKRVVLKNSAKISECLQSVIDNFYSETPNGIDRLLLKNISELDKIKNLLDENSLKKIEELNSIYIDIQELANYFSSLMNEEFDVSSLDKIEERIESYRRISRKHKIEESNLLEFKNKLIKVADSTLELEKITNEYEKVYLENVQKFENGAKKLSEMRKNSAIKLDEFINQEFPSLKLENAKFKSFFEDTNPSQNGIDKVTFKIKTNPNSEMGAIKNISSGGELCRIALAIKVIAQKKNKTTMVFDEVDSGIGGAVSSAVGERLKKLGESKQVIVVTHSPQVAAFGNDHFIVEKNTESDKSIIKLKKLNNEEKLKEIARMLSGKEITLEAVNAARKLINH
jgi:DNA repair protein RecN (Recombination protein N)